MSDAWIENDLSRAAADANPDLFRNANLRRTRDLLLPKLVSGEVDVEQVDVGDSGA